MIILDLEAWTATTEDLVSYTIKNIFIEAVDKARYLLILHAPYTYEGLFIGYLHNW